MFKEVYVNGGEMEEVKLVEMSQEEMDTIRKQTISNLVKWLKNGFMDQNEFDKNIKEMEVSIVELKEAGLDKINEVLPFEINTDNEELKKIINTYGDTEDIEPDKAVYRGFINKSILYNLYKNSGYTDLYNEYYQLIICKDELKTILTYCEGDFIAEVYNSIENYNAGIERTKKFIEEM